MVYKHLTRIYFWKLLLENLFYFNKRGGWINDALDGFFPKLNKRLGPVYSGLENNRNHSAWFTAQYCIFFPMNDLMTNKWTTIITD